MSYRCEHGKDSDVCVQCWEEKNLEPKDMTTPNQPTEAEQAIKNVVYWNKILGDAKKYQAIEDALKAEPELDKAVEELFSFGKDEEVTQDMIDVCMSLDVVLNAAKRLKVVEKERECWIYNANELQKGYNKIDKELSQLRTEYKQALEALKLVGPDAGDCFYAEVEQSWLCKYCGAKHKGHVKDIIHSNECKWSFYNKVLCTPSAIAAMKGETE